MRFSVAPIGLQRIVNEMTLHPRPASLRQTFAVETDHPLIQLLPGCPVHAHEGCSHSVTPSLKDLFQDFRRRRQMPPIPTHPPVQRTQPLSDIHDLLVAHRKVATGKRIWVMRASCALAPLSDDETSTCPKNLVGGCVVSQSPVASGKGS